jgi:hypothetical protein
VLGVVHGGGHSTATWSGYDSSYYASGDGGTSNGGGKFHPDKLGARDREAGKCARCKTKIVDRSKALICEFCYENYTRMLGVGSASVRVYVRGEWKMLSELVPSANPNTPPPVTAVTLVDVVKAQEALDRMKETERLASVAADAAEFYGTDDDEEGGVDADLTQQLAVALAMGDQDTVERLYELSGDDCPPWEGDEGGGVSRCGARMLPGGLY